MFTNSRYSFVVRDGVLCVLCDGKEFARVLYYNEGDKWRSSIELDLKDLPSELRADFPDRPFRVLTGIFEGIAFGN